ncbi:MAG TPA: hypothetical protein VGO94_08620, partial [Mycobacteriales bacterium]|nr:hypothetical protein [Mycobacteriales bacterium]
NTVIVIEHNLDVIKNSDWVIDMGPEGGNGGGAVVAVGTPEDIAVAEGSHTGRYLRDVLHHVGEQTGDRAAPRRASAATSAAGVSTAAVKAKAKATAKAVKSAAKAGKPAAKSTGKPPAKSAAPRCPQPRGALGTAGDVAT